MKKLGSYLIILLLITAYGRCLADQMGALHDSGSACCVTTCCDVEHNQSDSDQQQEEEEPPCHLCIILSSDSIMLQDGLEIPTPSLYGLDLVWHDYFTTEPEISEIFCYTSGVTPFGCLDFFLGYCAQQQRIVAKCHPVRGPSVLTS